MSEENATQVADVDNSTNENNQEGTSQDQTGQEGTSQDTSQKSNKDYIIERKDSKIAKLTAQLEKAGVSLEDDKIQQAVDNKLGDSLDFVQELKLSASVDKFVAENKHFADHKNTILQYAKNDSWKNIPIENIAYAVVGKDLLGVGADLKAKADAQANASKVGGKSLQVNSNDYANMSDEEFDKVVAQARSNY